MFSTARRRVLLRMTGGLTVASVPIAVWWYHARQQRGKLAEEVRTKIRIPGSQDILDQIIEDRCQAGDVVLFDRRPETAAASPWAALACLVAKGALCDEKAVRTVSEGRFDHVGIVVPGYIKSKADVWDPANLMLLEATAGEGIVARPLKSRLEHSQARSIVLVPLQVPGERRNAIGDDDEDHDATTTPGAPPQSAQALAATRTRNHLEKELRQFRDKWIQLGADQNYKYMHSTLTLGGALMAALGLQAYASGPVSPSAWLTLMALQQGAAATNLDVKQRNRIIPEDFLRHPTIHDDRSVRLRPGFRFLAPVNVRSR
mmetsp:Transcript_8990/g.17184  ORF Transcript_8990/g.17184 Transcript_8990/m.17184 type:complete len:317 (-) Transcript_8990:47-997(-)|eukprot:scaffold2629_cov152-Amphora_coffeaeformis.AAC.2